MKSEIKKSGSSAINLVVLGASLAGLAASVFFFFGPKGKENQKHAKAWAIKMKGEVIGRLEMADEVSEAIYQEIIDSVAAEYKKGMKAGDEEINTLAQDMKEHWKAISRSARETKLDVEKDAKKAAKKNNNKKED